MTQTERSVAFHPLEDVQFDLVKINSVIRALRKRDLTGCREPEILHVVKVLEWLIDREIRLDLNLSGFVQVMCQIKEGASGFTPQMATSVHRAYQSKLGFGKEWEEFIRSSLDENRSPEGYERIVHRLQERNGLSKAQAMRAVAEQAGVQPETVKKALQRLGAKRRQGKASLGE